MLTVLLKNTEKRADTLAIIRYEKQASISSS